MVWLMVLCGALVIVLYVSVMRRAARYRRWYREVDANSYRHKVEAQAWKEKAEGLDRALRRSRDECGRLKQQYQDSLARVLEAIGRIDGAGVSLESYPGVTVCRRTGGEKVKDLSEILADGPRSVDLDLTVEHGHMKLWGLETVVFVPEQAVPEKREAIVRACLICAGATLFADAVMHDLKHGGTKHAPVR